MNKSTRIVVGEKIKNLSNQYDFIVVNTDTKATGLENFREINNDRTVNLGIAEQNMIAFSAGISSFNKKIIISIFGVFISLRSLEQFRTFICYTELNVTILSTHTGLQVGEDGATHTAIEDISIMRSIPNLTIIQPSDEISASKMVKFILEFNGPLYVRLHKKPTKSFHDDNYKFDFYTPDTLISDGNDLVIFTTGIILENVMEARDILLKKGFKITIVDFKVLKPLNIEYIINTSKKFPAILTVEDSTEKGGFGSSIVEVLSTSLIPIEILGIKDCFSSSGSEKDLYKKHKLDSKNIAKKCISMIGEYNYE